METSLNEGHEGWKKAQDDLLETSLENLDMSKEYAKSMEYGYYVLHVYFENIIGRVTSSTKGWGGELRYSNFMINLKVLLLIKKLLVFTKVEEKSRRKKIRQ